MTAAFDAVTPTPGRPVSSAKVSVPVIAWSPNSTRPSMVVEAAWPSSAREEGEELLAGGVVLGKDLDRFGGGGVDQGVLFGRRIDNAGGQPAGGKDVDLRGIRGERAAAEAGEGFRVLGEERRMRNSTMWCLHLQRVGGLALGRCLDREELGVLKRSRPFVLIVSGVKRAVVLYDARFSPRPQREDLQLKRRTSSDALTVRLGAVRSVCEASGSVASTGTSKTESW